MTDRKALESALLTHGSEWWDDNDRGLYADELIDCFGERVEDMDAPGFAHIVWTMGYTSAHPGHCRYRDEDANDGDYEIECEACKRELTEMGHKVLADITRKAGESDD